MLHAVFQLLVNIVEKEKPDRIVDWNWDEEHRRAWAEIRALYRWWKRERPARKDPLDDRRLKHPPMRWRRVSGTDCSELVPPDEKKYRKYLEVLRKSAELEEEWQKEDQRQLHRLVDVRPYLWT